MSSALIISSYVAASRVGGFVQALALSAQGVEPKLVPTVLFGRHPGLGPPGGGAVGPETFFGVLSAAEAQDALRSDLILTGYFALAAQVEATADAIVRARALPVKPIILVDPILGDEETGLYIKPEVEDAVRDRLLPLADVLTPNLWELRRLTGLAAYDAQSAAAAARTLSRPVLISSIPCGPDQIGVLYVDGPVAWIASHAKAVTAPRGTGDLMTALFAAGLIQNLPPQTALARAVGGVADAVEASLAAGLADLPVASIMERLRAPLSRVILTTLA
jgi:pyridoxine kinase